MAFSVLPLEQGDAMFLTPTEMFDILVDEQDRLADMLPSLEVWRRSKGKCVSCGVGVAGFEGRYTRKGFVVHASTFWVDAPDELPMDDPAALVLLCGLCRRYLEAHPDSSSATTLLEKKRQHESTEPSFGGVARALRAALRAKGGAGDCLAALWIARVAPSFLGHAVVGGCAVQSMSSPDARVRHFLAMATDPEHELAPVEISIDPVLPLLGEVDLLGGFKIDRPVKDGIVHRVVLDGIRYRVDVEVGLQTAMLFLSNPGDEAMRRLEREIYRAATAYAEISKDERAAAYVHEWKSYLSRS